MRVGTRGVPIEYYTLRIAGPKGSRSGVESAIVGYLAERPIFGTVTDALGTRYRYVGLAARLPDGRYDIEALFPGEWIVEPGLIYKSEDELPRAGKRATKSTGIALALRSWLLSQ
ncbi:hypothetical protein [Mesorhizobium sp.]|uniref:hypothetical protein n=1 Tax=Mesorhizobium sp. TaxID=1871066 RepID=UPI0025DEC55E|nr:hypothetical protein [Mesorhizobium sp.]